MCGVWWTRKLLRLIRQGKQVQHSSNSKDSKQQKQKEKEEEEVEEQQQQQAEQAHRIISKLYLRLTRVPCALVMFTARLRPCHVCPEDGHPLHPPPPLMLVLCVVRYFWRFSCWFMQNCGIFQLHFHSSCRTCCCGSSSCASFASLRFASTCFVSLPVRPEFALFAACLCKCVRSIQFSHICATLLSNVQHIATFIVVVLVLLCC